MIWIDVLLHILTGITSALSDGLFWIVVGLVAFQHWRIARNREQFFGLRGGSVFLDTAYATGFGILGGILGSFLLIMTGVTLDSVGITYIWPLALVLMLISPRFLCFAYSGGIIALSSLLLGFPRDIGVPHLMALIAILHLVESFLILLSGHRSAVPIYTRSKDKVRIVGGFTLQRFWPIPLVAMIMVSPADVNSTFTLIPVLAALGYGDLAIARTPAQKSKISARNLSLYSVILLILAMLSSEISFFKYLAVLFAPLGHELVIYLGQKIELEERPIFVPPPNGVMVLEAVPHTLAGDMGIKPGDVIFTLNGIPVNSIQEIEAALTLCPAYVQIEYVGHSDGHWRRNTASYRRGKAFGVIPVPQGNEQVYMELNTKGLLHKLWRKFSH